MVFGSLSDLVTADAQICAGDSPNEQQKEGRPEKSLKLKDYMKVPVPFQWYGFAVMPGDRTTPRIRTLDSPCPETFAKTIANQHSHLKLDYHFRFFHIFWTSVYLLLYFSAFPCFFACLRFPCYFVSRTEIIPKPKEHYVNLLK